MPLEPIPSRKTRGVGKIRLPPLNEQNELPDEPLTDSDMELLDSLQIAQEQTRVIAPQLGAQIPNIDEFVEHHLDAFASQLYYGVHPHVAAAQEGVPLGMFNGWMTVGKRDYESDNPELHQTSSAKLYRCVLMKVAERRAMAETIVASKQPLEYLRRGAARMLGDDWVDTREMVLADKAGLIVREGNQVVGTQVIVTAQNIEQVLEYYKEYNIRSSANQLGADGSSNRNNITNQPSTIEVVPESVSIENTVKNREEITQLERPARPPVEYDLGIADLKRLRGG